MQVSKTFKGSERVHKLPLVYTGGTLCPVAAYSLHVAEFPSSGGDEQQPAFRYDNRKGKRTSLANSRFWVEPFRSFWKFVGKMS